MPWMEVSAVESRRMFIAVVESGKCSFSEACRRFGVSRKTGYKWLARYRSEGEGGLHERSRRPKVIRHATSPEVVELVVKERKAHPDWGARKICARLNKRGIEAPPERTANRILKRSGMVKEREVAREEPQRFERPRPNDLWQIDHKAAVHGRWFRRAVPLAILDDCSRYLLGLRSLPDKGFSSTWAALWDILREFGLPLAILSDCDRVFHGSVGPSRLEVRLMRLGIEIFHGRPYHPQTQGKVERLNGTLERAVLRDGHFRTPEQLQTAFDRFRYEYNFERPHDALGLEVPGSRYQPSPKPCPQRLPEMEYPSGAVLRKVQKDGWISWKGLCIEVGMGLHGERVEVRDADHEVEVYFGPYRILGTEIDENTRTRSDKVGGRKGKKMGLAGRNSASGYALRSIPSREKNL